MTSPGAKNRPRSTAAPAVSLRLAVQYSPGSGSRALLPLDRGYFGHLFARHGRSLDESQLTAGHTAFTDLVAGLVPRLAADPGCSGGFEAAVMASTVSDAESGWPMCHLAAAFPGTRLSFGIADQGRVGAFTALRLTRDRACAVPSGRTLMVALDQASVLHDGPVPEHLRATVNAGVALVMAPSAERDAEPHAEQDAVRVGAPVVSRVAPGDLAVRWAEILPRATPYGSVTLIAGAGLGAMLSDVPRLPHGITLRTAAEGRPCTGIWAVLADELPRPRDEGGRRLVVADYDADLGRLAHCTVTVGPDPGAEQDPFAAGRRGRR